MKVEYWTAKNGRTYWHEKVRGRVKRDGSYSNPSNCRRALRAMYPGVEPKRIDAP